MTYTVVTVTGQTDYGTVREASIAFGRLATSRHEAIMLGPNTDGTGTRERIATYYPPPEVTATADRRAPQKGSAVAYWYAIGWIDSTLESGWLRDSHATQFAIANRVIDPGQLRGRWVEFLEDNSPE